MSGFPQRRMRRMRRTENLRRLARENVLRTDDLIHPLFVVPGEGVRDPIPSMPGCFRFSVDTLLEECREARDLGVPAVLLFGVPEHKDGEGAGAWDDDGVVQHAVRALHDAFNADGPDAPGRLEIVTDVCLCEYADHGHCGPVRADGSVDNDAALDLLARTAVSHARAGASMVAPSDMMDGRVGRLRRALDEAGFEEIPIMSYAAKFASAWYGPFRDAADSAPRFGDRRGYQMDPANGDEALEEVRLDVEEGADVLMVKPGLPCLDVLRRVRERFNLPLAVYNVSGEYAAIKAAAERGWLDERRVALETLTAFKRAGADMILTYFAKDAARWLREDGAV